jgi:hypothetical protein
MPFMQDELLFDTWDTRDATIAGVPPTPGLNQNRTMLGVGLQLADNVRLDLGLLLRARQQPGMADWALDYGPWIQLFVDVPKRAQSATGQSATGQSAMGQSATGTRSRRGRRGARSPLGRSRGLAKGHAPRRSDTLAA